MNVLCIASILVLMSGSAAMSAERRGVFILGAQPVGSQPVGTQYLNGDAVIPVSGDIAEPIEQYGHVIETQSEREVSGNGRLGRLLDEIENSENDCFGTAGAIAARIKLTLAIEQINRPSLADPGAFNDVIIEAAAELTEAVRRCEQERVR